MKYSELSDREAESLRSLYLAILDAKSREDQEYNKASIQLLVVGNGGGIAILGSFMVSLATRGVSYRWHVLPLSFFLIGAVLAALTYVPVLSVSAGAVTYIAQSLERLFKDELPLEQLQSYGLKPLGRLIILGLLIGSMLSFFTAVLGTLVVLLRV